MSETKLTYKDDMWNEIPQVAYIALGRRGREAISLVACMIPGCDNNIREKLHPLEKRIEEHKDKQKNTKVRIVHYKIYCEKCGKVYNLNFKQYIDLSQGEQEDGIVLEEVYATDEKDEVDFGNIGYVQTG